MRYEALSRLRGGVILSPISAGLQFKMRMLDSTVKTLVASLRCVKAWPARAQTALRLSATGDLRQANIAADIHDPGAFISLGSCRRRYDFYK